ncbi:MAG TPA: PAS domain S-box protein, partial [Gammaproteobacteria bacterium]|nr:PAS domain S-box protein [Gammaproteobacteria bacterium]
MCVFAAHSAIRDPPFSKLDLVSCRNLLIYMTNDLQDRVVRRFHYALKPGGWLFLGASEGVSRNSRLFSTVDKKHRLFRRVETEEATLPDVEPRMPRVGTPTPAEPRPEQARGGGDALDRRARRLMEKYAVPYVIVDGRREILRFSGGTINQYLEPSAGNASLEVLGMLRKALRPTVRTALQQAFENGEAIVHESVPLRIDGKARAVTVIVEPLDSPGNDGIPDCVVAFQDGGPARGSAEARAGHDGGVAAALEHELRVTKAQLNSAIADLETANEEMRSANEEYQSVNEELQSSNEELETSKEEMQSINEELQTVNVELGHKNESLGAANSDLRNLLESTQIATLFLDSRLCIRGFTPGIQEIFHLRDSDRGRPVTDIVTRLNYQALRRDAEKVLRDLAVIEHEVQVTDGEGETFIMRIRPYRTVDNVIDGVVITFTDISERKRSEEAQARLAALVNASYDAIIGHSLDGRIVFWNSAAERIFGYSASEAIGKPMTMLIPEEQGDEVPALIERLQRGESVPKYDVIRETRDGQRIDLELSISPTPDQKGKMIAAATIARDISTRLEHEAHRELLMNELSHRVKNTLAIVQSIMMQTIANAPSLDAFGKIFAERIAALATAHDLLMRSNWRGVRLDDLIAAELKPYFVSGKECWRLDGPAVEIAPNQAIALAMAFHELATNAAKYGALSAAEGCVEVQWRLEAREAARILHIDWAERQGPPVVEPKRYGFGMRLVREGLSYELEAKVNLDFAPNGLHGTIAFP